MAKTNYNSLLRYKSARVTITNSITLCEENKLFPKDDLLWNAAVTAGNKMVTAGTTWTRFNDVGSLTSDERKALLGYLDLKG